MAPGPVAQVRAELAALLGQAARALGCPAVPAPVSFSADGRGGDLASPYPQILGVCPAELASALPAHPDVARCYPGGTWLRFDLSPDWWRRARSWRPDAAALDLPPLPPVPDFPARIPPASWRLNALLGAPRPETAARLDRGNPAQLVRLARCLAARGGEPRADRALAGQALLLPDLREPRALARELVKLAQAYLRQPGENVLVCRALDWGAAALGVAGA